MLTKANALRLRSLSHASGKASYISRSLKELGIKNLEVQEELKRAEEAYSKAANEVAGYLYSFAPSKFKDHLGEAEVKSYSSPSGSDEDIRLCLYFNVYIKEVGWATVVFDYESQTVTFRREYKASERRKKQEEFLSLFLEEGQSPMFYAPKI